RYFFGSDDALISDDPAQRALFFADRFGKEDESVHKRIGSGWASGYVYIYRQELVYALYHTIYIIHSARVGARPHGDYPSGLHHLFMKAFNDRRHFNKYCAGNNHDVGFPGCSPDNFSTEAGEVV